MTNPLRIEIVDPEATILREIADRTLHQRDIAQTYALISRQISQQTGKVDWLSINRAIIERWSVSGLGRVKRLAWSGKCWEAVR